MIVSIGRSNGPCTDLQVESDFSEEQIETIKDVVAMVNSATGNKEEWYVIVDGGPLTVITNAPVSNS